MNEAMWTAVLMALINTLGSVFLTWIRYYYRANYGLGEPPFSNSRRVNGNGDSIHGNAQSTK